MLKVFAAGLGGVLVSVLLISGQGSVGAADKKGEIPNIEDIMKRVNKPKGLHKTLGMVFESEKIDWTDVTKMTKEYSDLAGHLGKNKCPKGDAASWDKLCKSYATDAKTLDEAAGKKDKTAATAAWTRLQRSCQGCHDEHR